MKRLIILLICVLTITAFISCSGDDNTTTEDEGVEGITVSDLSDYDIIRPSGTTGKISSFGDELKAVLNEKYGIKLNHRSDIIRENIEAYQVKELEILVGETNRVETWEFLSGLRYEDYGYGVVNKKIVIAGHTEENTVKAMEKFMAEVVNKQGSSQVFLENKIEVVRGEYELDDLRIGGLSAKNMAIVYPTNGSRDEELYAEELSKLLSEKSGYAVKSYEEFRYKHKEGTVVILIGNTQNTYGIIMPDDLKVNEIYIQKGENAIAINAGGLYSLDQAVERVMGMIVNAEGDTVTDPSIRRLLSTETMSTMSFNILGWERTEERNQRVLTMINTYMPDTIGVQEDLPVWIELFEKELPFYSYVGIPADGTGGESCAIFYITEKFDLLDYGTRWLSDTPGEISKHPESSANKIVTYATFRCKDTGKIFTQLNTHLEYSNDTAREFQADKIVGIAEEFEGTVILTGDYNADSNSKTYGIIADTGYLNSSEAAKESHKGGTFHLYSGDDGPCVDYIFVNDNVNVLYYKVCNEKINGEYASDHHPVYAEYKIK
ncbi:MAG: endonuclease/exonuclease/phosphatase family protein [Clostridia bacterium]|nr:endonuclease/exonuclease/phosphatase family protein [Clostridia bacterium]